MKTRKIGRDASTGKFIPVKEAQRRKTTTMVVSLKMKQKPAVEYVKHLGGRKFRVKMQFNLKVGKEERDFEITTPTLKLDGSTYVADVVAATRRLAERMVTIGGNLKQL